MLRYDWFWPSSHWVCPLLSRSQQIVHAVATESAQAIYKGTICADTHRIGPGNEPVVGPLSHPLVFDDSVAIVHACSLEQAVGASLRPVARR